MIEEQHVSGYESLKDPNMTWLECMLNHEYTECYLYYSCYEDEKDPHIKALWQRFFMQEVAHLHKAAELLQKYENKHWQQVIPDGEFPALLSLHENKDYIRKVLGGTVNLTCLNENYVDVCKLPADAKFHSFQRALNTPVQEVPTHCFIQRYMDEKGMDYRFEIAPNPVPELTDRRHDNTCVGRGKMC